MALATKTVVFVTHQVEFLPAADLILVLPLMLPTPSSFPISQVAYFLFNYGPYFMFTGLK